MDISVTLRQAWAAVEAAEIPTELQAVGFREAIRLLAPAAGTAASSTSPAAPSDVNRTGNQPTSVTDLGASEEEIYDRVVKQTGVERRKLESVVHLDGDTLKISIPGLRLGKNNAERTRTVAQILTICRGFGLEESETPLDVVRAECDRLRVYDQNNFSAQLKALHGYVVVGSGANRRIRAKSPGIESFPTVLDHLTESAP